MDAIVLAGGIPAPGAALFAEARGGPKALIEIEKRPMIQYVLDALDRSPSIERIVVIGLSENPGLVSEKVVAYLPNAGGLLSNARKALAYVTDVNPQAQQILIASSDIPAITSPMIEWLIARARQTQADVSYHVIERAVMEQAFPGSRRTYVKLKGSQVCSGDMVVVSAHLASRKDELWERIFAARKNPFKLAALIGYSTLLRLFLRRLTLEAAAQAVSDRLELRGVATVCPYAPVGMDVDKPSQLELLRSYLQKQARAL